MSERGVFAVDRGLWSDPDFADEPFSEREAFLWLLSEAAWRPTSVRIGHHRVELNRGQCAFSTRFMAEKWKWSEARVRRYLGRLISAEIICTSADKIATHVTIRNYDKFQRVSLPDAETATHARRTSDAPQTHLRRKEEDRETRETNTPTDAIASSAPKGAGRQRGTRIPDGFERSDEARQVAAAFGLTGDAADEALAEFADYWRPLPGVKATKLDWIGTLRNQLRRVTRRRPAARASPPSGRSSPGSRLLDRMEARRAERYSESAQADHGPILDHEGDGGSYQQVHEQAGGQAGRFPSQAALRLVGSGRR